MAATKTTTFIKVTTPPMAIASNDITRDGSADAGMVEVIPVLFHVSIIYNNIIKKTKQPRTSCICFSFAINGELIMINLDRLKISCKSNVIL